EQRGLLTNVLHNALSDAFHKEMGWMAFQLYPDGVVYLGSKATRVDFDEEMLQRFGRYAASALGEILFGNPADLLQQTNQGIKFKPDALLSGIAFERLFHHARNLV